MWVGEDGYTLWDRVHVRWAVSKQHRCELCTMPPKCWLFPQGESSFLRACTAEIFDMELEEYSLVSAISADTASYFNNLYFLIGLACLPDNIS